MRIFAPGFYFRPSFLMPVFSFQSEDFLDPQVVSASALRMLVGTNGVTLMANKGEKVLALKSWHLHSQEHDFSSVESDLRMIFGGENCLGMAFASKKCALSSPAATLVPRRLFDPENLPQYFKLLLREQADRSFGYEKLEQFDCYLVWASQNGLLQLCNQYFNKGEIGHAAAALLKRYQTLAPAEGYAVFANIRGQKVQIVVFERQNLVFFNVFDYIKPSDLLYYVLLTYQQFGLNPTEISLSLSGTFMEDSEIFRLLQRYIRPLRFPPLPENITLPEQAKNLPAHFWFDLTII